MGQKGNLAVVSDSFGVFILHTCTAADLKLILSKVLVNLMTIIISYR